jgi:hypothetical protein
VSQVLDNFLKVVGEKVDLGKRAVEKDREKHHYICSYKGYHPEVDVGNNMFHNIFPLLIIIKKV